MTEAISEQTSSNDSISTPSISDLSLEALLDLVDQKIVQRMEEISNHLESLSQDNTLQKEELKQETTKVLNFYQMRLFTRILSVLVNPFNAQASAKTGIGRTVITAIVNGNLDKISTDRLIDIAQALGLKFHLKVA